LASILIVDDDKALCRTLEIQLDLAGHKVSLANDARTGLAVASALSPDLVLLDVNLPDNSGMTVLPEFVSMDEVPAVVIMTGALDNNIVVESMRFGAFDYLRKPINLDDVLNLTAKLAVNEQREKKQVETDVNDVTSMPMREGEMVGLHPTIVEIHKLLGLLSRSRVTVLIQGETGTGKDLAARILHEAGSRQKPFVAINCSAVVPSLLESELFGHERGAFTGADQQKIGKLEFAEDGTLFLDEIGDMPLDLQAKLLRVLQEDEFVRVGGLKPIRLKARVVTATHRNLQDLINQGKFREDLYFRLTVATINLPPLRERRSDINLLVPYLLNRISTRLGVPACSVDNRAMQKLMYYDWPGNIRELDNVLTSNMALAKGVSVLGEDNLNFPENKYNRSTNVFHETGTLAEAEKNHIEKSLNANGWNISRTSRVLDVSPTTLRKKITDYRLNR